VRSIVVGGNNVTGPILAIFMLAVFVALLVVLEPGPARAQDQYSDQYQYDDSSSAAPDYTPDPPQGCYSYPDDPSAHFGYICLNGTEPSRNGRWLDTLTNMPGSTGEPVYTEDIYSLGLSNDPTQANSYIWRPWFYIPSLGWNPGD